jgi:hypothetical protein
MALGAPGPPRSFASAAGEAANATEVMLSRISTRLNLRILLLHVRSFIPLPLRAPRRGSDL